MPSRRHAQGAAFALTLGIVALTAALTTAPRDAHAGFTMGADVGALIPVADTTKDRVEASLLVGGSMGWEWSLAIVRIGIEAYGQYAPVAMAPGFDDEAGTYWGVGGGARVALGLVVEPFLKIRTGYGSLSAQGSDWSYGVEGVTADVGGGLMFSVAGVLRLGAQATYHVLEPDGGQETMAWASATARVELGF